MCDVITIEFNDASNNKHHAQAHEIVCNFKQPEMKMNTVPLLNYYIVSVYEGTYTIHFIVTPNKTEREREKGTKQMKQNAIVVF